MAKAMSIIELRKTLAAKERQLATLQTQQQRVAKQLASIDDKIAALGGERVKGKRKAGKKAARKVAAKKGKRAKRGPSLADVLADVLVGKGNVKVAQAAKLAVRAGYKSKSSQFGNIVSQTLSADKRFKKIARGVYTLRRGGKIAVTKSAKKVAGAPTKRKEARGKPLIGYVKDVLAKARDGMRVKEVMAAVQEAGYKSAAKDFYGIVATAVRGEGFEKLGRGVYRLKGMGEPAAGKKIKKKIASKKPKRSAKAAAKKAVASVSKGAKKAAKRTAAKGSKTAKKAVKKRPKKKRSATKTGRETPTP